MSAGWIFFSLRSIKGLIVQGWLNEWFNDKQSNSAKAWKAAGAGPPAGLFEVILNFEVLFRFYLHLPASLPASQKDFPSVASLRASG